MAELTPQPIDRLRIQPSSAPATPGRKRGYCFTPAGRRTRTMADLSQRWDKGSTLNVSFLNGTDAWGQTIQQAVQQYAPNWSDCANLTFAFGQPTAHVAVNLIPYDAAPLGTYSSFIGRDCLAKFEQGQPSMNLVFNPQLQSNPALMQEEFQRAIRHEFGHAIGLIHEHQRPDRPIKWNEDVLVQYFGPGTLNNWSLDKIREQIESVYQGGTLDGTAFDPLSIMMYWFPDGAITYSDGSAFPSSNNTELSAMDKVLANMLYPATGVTDPDEVILVPGDPATAGAIQVAGQVARYRFHVLATGSYTVSAQGDDALLVSVLDQRQEPAGQLLALEGASVSLNFQASPGDRDYFAEVRHARPMKGTCTFSVAVQQQ